MAAIAFHMSRGCTVQRELDATVAAACIDTWSVVGAGVNMQPRYRIGLGGSMRVSRWLVAAGVMLMVAGGQAAFAQASSATTSTQLNSQQQKMKECAQEGKAKGVKGEERKAFMSSCLSSKGMSQEDINKQQQKMKTCNVDAKAKNLKGADYKAFMKTCLSGSG
jgi:hypothetical protein